MRLKIKTATPQSNGHMSPPLCAPLHWFSIATKAANPCRFFALRSTLPNPFMKRLAVPVRQQRCCPALPHVKIYAATLTMMQPKALCRPLSDPFTLASAHFNSRSCSRHPSRSAILGSPCSSNRGSNCKMYKKPSHSAHRPKAAQLTEEHVSNLTLQFRKFGTKNP